MGELQESSCIKKFSIFTRRKMKSQGNNSSVIIWTSCAVCLLVETVVMTYAYKLYGIYGTTIVIFLSIAALQPFKLAYEWYARHGNYGLKLVVRTTNYWTIYQIIDSLLCTGGVFAYMIIFGERETFHIPKSVWLVAVVILACVWSIWPIQSFVRKEEYNGKRRRPTNLISSFAPRFVILYTFVVYYFIACYDTIEANFIPTLCVIYLGVDRLITMFNQVREYEQQEYYSLFRDTVKWIREERNH